MRAIWRAIRIPCDGRLIPVATETVEGEEHRGMSSRNAGVGSAMVDRVMYQASAVLHRLGNWAICTEKGVQTVDTGC